MTTGPGHPIDLRLYRMCLKVCPPSFVREFADDMVRDFRDARAEAAAAGGRRLWRLRFLMTIDLIRTVGTQWMRTRWPLIGLASFIAPLLLAATIAAVARRAHFVVPPNADQSETLGILLLATISVCLIAMTIALTVWAARPRPRRR